MKTKQLRINLSDQAYAKIRKLANDTYRTNATVILMLLAQYEEKNGVIIVEETETEEI